MTFSNYLWRKEYLKIVPLRIKLYIKTSTKIEQELRSQGGMFPGSQGARLPRNLQAPTKCWQKFPHFCHKFDRKVFSANWSKKFLSNKCFPAERRDFLAKKYYHKQTLSSGRNVLPQKEISYHSKKFLATRRSFFVISRNFLSQEEISCQRKRKFTLQ